MNFIVTEQQIEEAFLSLIEDGVSVKISECAYVGGEMISGDLHARRLDFGYRVSFGYKLENGRDYIDLGTIINAIPNRLLIDNVKEVKYRRLVGNQHLSNLYMLTGGSYTFKSSGRVVMDTDECIHVFDIILETNADNIIDFLEARLKKVETKTKSKSVNDYNDMLNDFISQGYEREKVDIDRYRQLDYYSSKLCTT
jgi:hypothetical protein